MESFINDFSTRDYKFIESLDSLAEKSLNRSQISEAINFYTQSLNLKKALYGENSLRFKISISDMFAKVHSMGRKQLSKDEARESLRTFNSLYNLLCVYSNSNTENEKAEVLNSRASAHKHLKNWKEAKLSLKNALKLSEDGKISKKNCACLHLNLASVYSELRKHLKAVSSCKKSVKYSKSVLSEGNISNSNDLEFLITHLALSYKTMGKQFEYLSDKKSAGKSYEKAMNFLKTHGGPSQYSILKDTQKSLKRLEKATFTRRHSSFENPKNKSQIKIKSVTPIQSRRKVPVQSTISFPKLEPFKTVPVIVSEPEPIPQGELVIFLPEDMKSSLIGTPKELDTDDRVKSYNSDLSFALPQKLRKHKSFRRISVPSVSRYASSEDSSQRNVRDMAVLHRSAIRIQSFFKGLLQRERFKLLKNRYYTLRERQVKEQKIISIVSSKQTECIIYAGKTEYRSVVPENTRIKDVALHNNRVFVTTNLLTEMVVKIGTSSYSLSAFVNNDRLDVLTKHLGDDKKYDLSLEIPSSTDPLQYLYSMIPRFLIEDDLLVITPEYTSEDISQIQKIQNAFRKKLQKKPRGIYESHPKSSKSNDSILAKSEMKIKENTYVFTASFNSAQYEIGRGENFLIRIDALPVRGSPEVKSCMLTLHDICSTLRLQKEKDLLIKKHEIFNFISIKEGKIVFSELVADANRKLVYSGVFTLNNRYDYEIQFFDLKENTEPAIMIHALESKEAPPIESNLVISYKEIQKILKLENTEALFAMGRFNKFQELGQLIILEEGNNLNLKLRSYSSNIDLEISLVSSRLHNSKGKSKGAKKREKKAIVIQKYWRRALARVYYRILSKRKTKMVKRACKQFGNGHFVVSIYSQNQDLYSVFGYDLETKNEYHLFTPKAEYKDLLSRLYFNGKELIIDSSDYDLSIFSDSSYNEHSYPSSSPRSNVTNVQHKSIYNSEKPPNAEIEEEVKRKSYKSLSLKVNVPDHIYYFKNTQNAQIQRIEYNNLEINRNEPENIQETQNIDESHLKEVSAINPLEDDDHDDNALVKYKDTFHNESIEHSIIKHEEFIQLPLEIDDLSGKLPDISEQFGNLSAIISQFSEMELKVNPNFDKEILQADYIAEEIESSNQTSFKDEIDIPNKTSFKDKIDIPSKTSFKDKIDISNKTSFKDEIDISNKTSFKDEIDIPSKTSFKDKIDISNKTSFKDKIEISDKTSFKDERDIPNKTSFKDEIDIPSKTNFKDKIDIPNKTSFKDEIDIPNKKSFKDENTQFEATNNEEAKTEEIPTNLVLEKLKTIDDKKFLVKIYKNTADYRTTAMAGDLILSERFSIEDLEAPEAEFIFQNLILSNEKLMISKQKNLLERDPEGKLLITKSGAFKRNPLVSLQKIINKTTYTVKVYIHGLSLNNDTQIEFSISLGQTLVKTLYISLDKAMEYASMPKQSLVPISQFVVSQLLIMEDDCFEIGSPRRISELNTAATRLQAAFKGRSVRKKVKKSPIVTQIQAMKDKEYVVYVYEGQGVFTLEACSGNEKLIYKLDSDELKGNKIDMLKTEIIPLLDIVEINGEKALKINLKKSEELTENSMILPQNFINKAPPNMILSTVSSYSILPTKIGTRIMKTQALVSNKCLDLTFIEENTLVVEAEDSNGVFLRLKTQENIQEVEEEKKKEFCEKIIDRLCIVQIAEKIQLMIEKETATPELLYKSSHWITGIFLVVSVFTSKDGTFMHAFNEENGHVYKLKISSFKMKNSSYFQKKINDIVSSLELTKVFSSYALTIKT